MTIIWIFMISWLGNAKADSEQIRTTIRDHIVEVRKCYENELDKKSRSSKKSKKIGGKLVVEFDIDDKGKVGMAEIKKESTDLNDPEVMRCVLAAIKSWDFPKAPKGDTFRIVYPFVFSAE